MPIADTGIVLRQLDELATEANRRYKLAEESYRSALDHAWHAGSALLAAKEQLPHGEWLGWLADNFDGSERHAQRCMTLARADPTRVSELDAAGVSLRGALREVAAPRPALRQVEDTLAGLGSSEGAMDEFDEASPEPELEPWAGFRRSGAWRKAMGSVETSVRKGDLKVATVREMRGLIPEAAADLLREAASAYGEAAQDLRALADHILEGRGRR